MTNVGRMTHGAELGEKFRINTKINIYSEKNQKSIASNRIFTMMSNIN